MYTESDDVIGTVTLYIYIAFFSRVVISSFRIFARRDFIIVSLYYLYSYEFHRLLAGCFFSFLLYFSFAYFLSFTRGVSCLFEQI